MHPISTSHSTPNSPNYHIDVAYDRFLSEGHIGALTLGAFLPATILGHVWVVIPALHEGHGIPGLAILLFVDLFIAVIWLYGIVGFSLGRKQLKQVLRGNISLRTIVIVVVGAYVFNTGYYIFKHPLITTGFRFSSFDALLDFAELCIFAPLSEELAFQGFVQTRLQRFGIAQSMVLTTIIFVVMHVQESTGFTTSNITHTFEMLFPTLFISAAVRQYTGSLLAVIILHSLYNANVLFLPTFFRVT